MKKISISVEEAKRIASFVPGFETQDAMVQSQIITGVLGLAEAFQDAGYEIAPPPAKEKDALQ